MSESVRAFVVALGIGLVLLIVAAVHDRRQRLLAERIEIAPLEEPVQPDAPAPPPPGRRYVRRTAAPFTADERTRVGEWQRHSSTRHVPASLADAALATHLDPATSIVHDATVLVSDDPVTEVREVLSTAKRALDDSRSLLIVAPACSPEVVELLSVNLHAGTLAGCVAIAEDAARAQVCEITGATKVGTSQLRGDFLPPSSYGHAWRVLCDADELWIGPLNDDEGSSDMPR